MAGHRANEGAMSEGRRHKRWTTGFLHGMLVRSGFLTLTLVIVALLIIAIGWHEHIQGQFGRLKRELKGPAPVTAPAIQPPGGQEPIVLQTQGLLSFFAKSLRVLQNKNQALVL